MNRTTSFHCNEKPNHPIVKALNKKGYSDFEIAYSTRSLSDCGWTIINTSYSDNEIFGEWLGFTIKDSLKTIETQIKLNNHGKD